MNDTICQLQESPNQCAQQMDQVRWDVAEMRQPLVPIPSLLAASSFQPTPYSPCVAPLYSYAMAICFNGTFSRTIPSAATFKRTYRSHAATTTAC